MSERLQSPLDDLFRGAVGISRKLFTRDQKGERNCNQGHGASDSADANCPYKKAPFFNVLAAFWMNSTWQSTACS